MLVSIIIPVYNVANYIERCLESVYCQTYSDIEVIIVDDCTPDNSMEIVYSVIAKYKAHLFTKIIKHKNNQGLSGARNTGIKQSTGEYLYFLDSDDSISFNAISVLVENLFNNKTFDMVIGNINQINGKTFVGSYFNNPTTSNIVLYSNNETLKTYLQGFWYPMAWNKLIKKKFILENKLFFNQGIFHEDMLWSFLVALKINAIIIDKTQTYNYFIRSNSIMTSTNSKNITDLMYIYSEMFNEVKWNSTQHYRDPNMIKYLEDFKFNILYPLSKLRNTSLLYKKLKSLDSYSWSEILVANISFKTKIRSFFWLLPSSLMKNSYHFAKFFYRR